MAQFDIGIRVSYKRNPNQKGRIDFILPPSGGYQFYEVKWDNGSLETIAEHDLQPEVIINSPWDLLANNSLSDYRDFSVATTLHKVRNSTANTISTLKASRTLFKPYQYKPLVKFLNSELKRILIADEVGLGKTIEAGHIMLEMAARGDLHNALVICTNSLTDKWKIELQDKFNFILKKYTSPADLLADISLDIEHSRRSIFGIVNYEKVRNEKLQNLIESSGYRFDLLICDEAHYIRNSATQQHKGVVKFIDNSDAVVLLTATPIMTNLTNLHNLIRVLDRDGYDTYDIFRNAINLNKPFIQALNQLNSHVYLVEIAERLHDSHVIQEMTADEVVYHSTKQSIGEIFANDKLYLRTRSKLLEGKDTIKNRVSIQQDLTELNSLNHLYVRTRKREVSETMVKRNPRTCEVILSEGEQAIYDSVINKYVPESLGLIQKKRQISSCIVTYNMSREQLISGNFDHNLPDAKFNVFNRIIHDVVISNKKKIIVFATFHNTLFYLQSKLNAKGINTEIILGGFEDRTERLQNFHDNDEIKVLLSSEVGSEGIDLQFCDAIVNYDLPWNPMVVEQRIGRIDRIGQISEVINIYNLIIKDTIEERIYKRLYERINLFRESLGDLEEILGEKEPLGEKIIKGIESLYKTKLSELEQEQKLEQLSMAVENERQNLDRIKIDLQEAFANDIYFINEIERITNNNRYLTKVEIIKYFESIIRQHLSSLQLNHIDDNSSEIIIPANSKNLLFDFIEKYNQWPSAHSELESLYKKFKATHYGSRRIAITFDQQQAYEHKTIEYISAFHPLVNAITNYFTREGFDKNLAFKIALKSECIESDKGILPGYYIFAIYRITLIKKYEEERINELHLLRHTMADLNAKEIKIIDGDISEYIYGVLQVKGEQMLENIPINKEAVIEIRTKIAKEILDTQKKIKEEEELKFQSAISRRTEQEINYINSRIRRIEQQLAEGKGIEAILKKEVENLTQKREKLQYIKSNAALEVNHTLISVNLLKLL